MQFNLLNVAVDTQQSLEAHLHLFERQSGAKYDRLNGLLIVQVEKHVG